MAGLGYKDNTGVLNPCSDGYLICPDCNGQGTVTCAECEGCGESTHECDMGYEHTVDCGECDEGQVECCECGGSGEVLDPDQETDEGL